MAGKYPRAVQSRRDHPTRASSHRDRDRQSHDLRSYAQSPAASSRRGICGDDGIRQGGREWHLHLWAHDRALGWGPDAGDVIRNLGYDAVVMPKPVFVGDPRCAARPQLSINAKAALARPPVWLSLNIARSTTGARWFLSVSALGSRYSGCRHDHAPLVAIRPGGQQPESWRRLMRAMPTPDSRS